MKKIMILLLCIALVMTMACACTKPDNSGSEEAVP
jgi:uncharacterized protein YxeA